MPSSSSFTYHPPGSALAAASTRHVRISWQKSGRRAKLVTAELVRALADAHGSVANFEPLLERGQAVLTYQTADEASGAVRALNGGPQDAFKGLRLKVEGWGATVSCSDAPGPGHEASRLKILGTLPPSVSSTTVPLIRGLTVIHDFVSPGEERELLSWLHGGSPTLDSTESSSSSGAGGWIGSGHMARRVQHFGLGFDYVSRVVAGAETAPGATSAAGSASNAAAATPLAATVPHVSSVPVGGPLARLSRRVCALGVCGDAGNHGWNHSCGSEAVAFQSIGGPAGAPHDDNAVLPHTGDGASAGGNPCSDSAPDVGHGAETSLRRTRTLVHSHLIPACEAVGVDVTGRTCSCTSFLGLPQAGGGSPMPHGSEGKTSCGHLATCCSYPVPDQITVNEYSYPAPDQITANEYSYPVPDQITVNEYTPGQGIGSHVDTHAGFQDGVASVSLGAHVVMDFVRQAARQSLREGHGGALPPEGCLIDVAADVRGRGRSCSRAPVESDGTGGAASLRERAGAISQHSGQPPPAQHLPPPLGLSAPAAVHDASPPAPPVVPDRVSVYLPPRSLLILRGEARYGWAHGIASRRLDVLDGAVSPRTGTRVSITLRRARFPQSSSSSSGSDSDISGSRGTSSSPNGVPVINDVGCSSVLEHDAAEECVRVANAVASLRTARAGSPSTKQHGPALQADPTPLACTTEATAVDPLACTLDPAHRPCACWWPTVCFCQAGGPSRPSVLLSPTLQKLAALQDGSESGGHAQSDKGYSSVDGALAGSASEGSGALQTRGTDDVEVRQASCEPHGISMATTSSLFDPGSSLAAVSTPLGKPPAPSSVGPSFPAHASKPTPSQKSQHADATRHTGVISAPTPAIESQHVHALYDAIAEHFSHTRYAPWPRVEAFIRSLPPGALLYDVGCGNGKYMGLRPDTLALGCDRSPPLAGICGRRGFNAVAGDALAVPFRPGCADAALSIAVLHHISTEQRRVTLLAQLLASVRPDGGSVFVQAWAAEQGADSRRDFSGGQDTLVPWCLARRFVTGSDEDVAAAGGAVDPGRNVVVFQRFVHAYRRGELEALLGAAAGQMGARLVDARPPEEAAAVPLPDSEGRAAAAVSSVEEAAPTMRRASPQADTCPGPQPAVATAAEVRLLSSWWDKDNWCIVAQRVAAAV